MLEQTPYPLIETNQLTPADQRAIRNLSASLCVAAGVDQQEHQLVALLGRGRERCNGDAMVTWVFEQLSRHHLEASREALPVLLNFLLRLEMSYGEVE